MAGRPAQPVRSQSANALGCSGSANRASIHEFGFTNPILVDSKAGIIAGRERLLAARKLGLSLELLELKESDFDLSLMGFDPKELDDLLTGADDELADIAPPLRDTPVSRAGHLWLYGDDRVQPRVLCGSCLGLGAVLPFLGERKPFLMCTAPPTESSSIQNGAIELA